MQGKLGFMGSKKKLPYDAEFREGAVRIVVETGRPAGDVAEELGINPGTPTGSGGTYGSPRITLDLWTEGWQVSVNTVAEIMAELGLQGRKPPRRRSLTRQGKRKAAPDLVHRRFDAVAPDVLWYGDMTEIETGEDKIYLATVIDAFSRRCLGYAMGEHHDTRHFAHVVAVQLMLAGGALAARCVLAQRPQLRCETVTAAVRQMQVPPSARLRARETAPRSTRTTGARRWTRVRAKPATRGAGPPHGPERRQHALPHIARFNR